MSDQCCQNCEFVALEKEQFHCRRYPPNAQVLIVPRKANVMLNQVVPVEETRSMFPNVHPGWICGEFALKVQLLS